MKTHAVALIAGLFAGAFASAAQAVAADVRAVSANDGFASPVLIVAPEYPGFVPGARATEVRINGTVTADGRLEGIDIPTPSGSERFVAAVRQVIELWRFRPAVSEQQCAPVAQKQSMFVWFDEKDGKPSVSVSMARQNPAAAKSTPKFSWQVRPTIDYPEAASTRGIEGAADVAVRIDRAGEIVGKTLVYATPHKMFGEAALTGLLGAKLLANSPSGAAGCYIVPFAFCTGPAATVPNSACRS
ncbi:MAG TPA: TonB family protein [Usitatibacteraceae bacterium]|nr:TonB family protein [Usitatibacteraceae bacterium]